MHRRLYRTQHGRPLCCRWHQGAAFSVSGPDACALYDLLFLVSPISSRYSSRAAWSCRSGGQSRHEIFFTLSWLLKMAHPNDSAAIAKRYGLLPNTLVGWIKTLAFVRNISAHHARLWNAGIINQPLVPKPFEARQFVHNGSDLERRTRVYGAAAVASYFVRRINPGASWPSRMKAHWHAFPAMPFASPIQGGFLAGWDAEAISA